MSIMHEVEELQKKAGSYDALKGEYDKLKAQVQEALRGLNAIAGKTAKKYGNRKLLINQLYEKMRIDDNYQLTTEQVCKFLEEQGELENIKIIAGNIMHELQKMPNVVNAKDGKKSRLFYDRTKDKVPDNAESDIKLGKFKKMY